MCIQFMCIYGYLSSSIFVGSSGDENGGCNSRVKSEINLELIKLVVIKPSPLNT